jgi:hypothetical protein
LDINSPQDGCFDTVSVFLGADVANKMVGTVGMAIDVAVEAGYAQTGFVAPAVFSSIKLLLRKLRCEKTQALKLLGIQRMPLKIS